MGTYNNILDSLIAPSENGPLYTNTPGGNLFYYDPISHDLNIGFGLDITTNSPDVYEAAFAAAGLHFSDTQLQEILNTSDNATAASVAALNAYLANPPASDPTATSFTGITQAQGYAMLNYYIDNVVYLGLTNDLVNYCGYTITDVAGIPANVFAGLEDLKYNANGAISSSLITNLNSDLAAAKSTGNWGAVAYDIGFNIGTAVQSRRTTESLIILGFDPSTLGSNPSTLAPLSSTSVSNSSLISYEQLVSSTLVFPSNFSTSQSALTSYLALQGYYVPQPADTWNSIASQVSSDNNVAISGNELQRLNGVLPGSNFSVGGLAYVPTSSALATPSVVYANGRTLVYDSAPVGLGSTAPIIYTVAPSLDGSDAGAFIEIKRDGTSVRFDAGTWEAYLSGTATGGDPTISVALSTPSVAPVVAPDINAVAFLTVDTVTDAGTLTLTDGTPIALNSIPAQAVLTDPVATPEQVLLGYLSDLGDPLSAAQLDALNLNFLDPTTPNPTPYTLTGQVQANGSNSAIVTYSLGAGAAPGAIIAGQSTAIIPGNPNPVPALNYLNITGNNIDLSQDAISGINILDDSFGNVFMTGAEFNSFGIIGATHVTITTPGTYTLVGSDSVGTLAAEDWGGTTLIDDSGNDIGNTLQASLFGNDTLIANNALGVLIAGEGVDTLVGGTAGGNTFEALNGLAAGSTITGQGSSNILRANGDISQASIGDVQNLTLNGAVTLSASELAGFSTISNSGTLCAATGGTYSLAGITTPAGLTLEATSASGTTLIGNNAANEELIASNYGNDTLTAGSGNGDILNATGSTGNDTFKLGSGNDTVNAGNGTDTFVITSNGSAQDTISNFAGLDTLDFTNVNASQVVASQSGNNLVLTIAADPVTIDNYFSGTASQSTSIHFANGVSWNYATVLAMIPKPAVPVFEEISGGGTFAHSGNAYTLSLDMGPASAGDPATAGFNLGVLNAAVAGADALSGNFSASGASAFTASGLAVVSNLAAGQADTSPTVNFSATSPGVYTETLTFTPTVDSLAPETLTATVNVGQTYNLTDNPGTVTGGAGDNVFILASGTLASGSAIDGGPGSDNTLEAATTQSNINISQASVTHIQTVTADSVTLTASQFAEVTTLNPLSAPGGYFTVNAATAGTYSLAGVDVTGTLAMHALSNAGTTLAGNDAASESLFASTTGNDTLSVGNGNYDFLLAGSGNDALSAGNGNNDYLVGGAGTDTLTAGDGSGDTLNAGSGNTVITAGNGNGDTLWASGNGNDTLTVGNGNGDTLHAGSGVDTMRSGTGNDTCTIGYFTGAGTVIAGGGGNDTLVDNSNSDISQMTISGVQTLQSQVFGSLKLTSAELAGFSSVVNEFSSFTTLTLEAAGAGTYDLSNVTGKANLDASETSADVTLIGNSQNAQVLTAGAGTDTLTAGSGSNDVLNAGSGNDALSGGGGYDSYKFGSGFGQDVITNNGGASPNGEIDFAGVSDQQLWFQQSGNNLLVDLLGTNDQITVAGWFGGNAGAQVGSFNADDGALANSQVLQLVQAMASYGANNPGFNPATATQMPTDSSLQSAIAANWHH